MVPVQQGIILDYFTNNLLIRLIGLFLFHFFKIQEFTEYKNLDVCYEFIQDLVIKHGPIDGLLGFSQGGILSASLPGLQAKVDSSTKLCSIRI